MSQDMGRKLASFHNLWYTCDSFGPPVIWHEVFPRQKPDNERKKDSMALTDEEFCAWCQRSKIEPETITCIQRIRSSEPERKVRGGASNVSGRYPSQKMGFSIDLKRFLDSGIQLVECPDCARTRTLFPRNGVLRFPAHSKRKTRTPNTEQRWAMEKTIWEVVGGERK